MKYYLKIYNDIIVEAPKTMVKENYTIYGYNNESNEKMLINDGYIGFDKPICFYTIKNNQIVQKEQQEEQIDPHEEQRNIFTKLQIRRACRQLNLEEKLNTLIGSNEKYKADWQDAQQINLDDNMFKLAVESNFFTNYEIQLIKDYIKFNF